MSSTRNATILRVGVAVALALAIGALAGCGGNSDSSSSSSSTSAKPVTGKMTAKQAAQVALSTLSTAAPEGRILVAQAAQALTPTSTPTWEFLVGNPKTDVLYAVLVMGGKGQFQQYGTAGLSKDEWTKVPTLDTWKIDSDVAYDKALAIYPNGKAAAYLPGFVTYIPKTAKGNTAKAMTWIFYFDSKSKGSAPTSTVEVDMATGQAAFAK